MRLVLSLLTVAAGAAAVVTWLSPVATENELAVVTSVGTGGVARVAVPVVTVHAPEQVAVKADTETAQPRFFGFALPFVSPQRPTPPATSQPSGERQPAQGWSTDVIAGSNRTRTQVSEAALRATSAPAVVIAPVPVPLPVRAVARATDKPMPQLVREIQAELKRVGCYAGDVDGEWGPGSRRAMQAFMARVNSALTNEEPDLIQLTLVRGYQGAACAPACPQERVAPGTGRCLQGPMVATRPTILERPDARRAATPPAPALAAGAVASPTIAIQSRIPPLPTGRTTAGSVEPSGAVVSTSVVPAIPLDGRMTIGGPVSPSADAIAAPPVSGVSVAPPVPRPARTARPSTQSQPTTRRAERNWTAGFFERN